MIRMCRVRLVDWVLTDALCERVGFVVKIQEIINQSRLCGVVMSCVETSIPKYVKYIYFECEIIYFERKLSRFFLMVKCMKIKLFLCLQ